MKVLITGATGLIGEELVKLYHEKGHAVNYLTSSKKKLVSKDNYKGFYWNPGNNEIDMSCFKDVSVIINLAGANISKRWTPKYKKKVLKSRVDALRLLHMALRKNGQNKVKSLISASAIGIYPDSIENFYSEEYDGVDDSFLGDVVKAWEQEITAFNDFDFKVAQIRIGLVMANNGGALPKMAKPIKNYVGVAFGDGEQWQSWIHVTDLARIFLFVAENRLEGTFNGVGPNPVTHKKLVKEIAKVLERPLILPNIPKFVMKLLLGEMSYMLFASQRVSSKKIEEEGFVFNFQNICAVLKHIYGKEGECNTVKSDLGKEYTA
ncbi:TIGR01777 family oxidoreductase [Maribacter sp. 2304DJ31-5]|uniref:TIGR01777 family oxidoreductase n=1 Tax=Maribacter sp. 2304DJ31-5 TaxID=3386273 RepID=UPI0039BC6C2E